MDLHMCARHLPCSTTITNLKKIKDWREEEGDYRILPQPER